MLPSKLNHGDSLARLFDRWNQLVDYLHEIRLVAGNGIRINRLPAGTTIESTATATAAAAAPPKKDGHPFDAEMINKGTEENPRYYVRIYNSALPDSPYAGVLTVYEWDMSVPVTEIEVTTQNGFFIVLDITYEEGKPPFSIQFSLSPHGSGSEVGYLTAREYIAEGKIPNVESRISGDIYVYGRWA